EYSCCGPYAELRSPKPADHACDVQDEHHSAIAQDRGAADQFGRHQMIVESFDHQLLFADQLVHYESKLPVAQRSDDHKHLLGRVRLPRQAMQVDKSQHVIAKLNDVVTVNAMDF